MNDKFPRAQRIANKIRTDIGFENEDGVGIMTGHRRTWGLKWKAPVVKVSMKRGGYNVLSTMTAQEDIANSIKDGKINMKRYIEFLEEIISSRERPFTLLMDHATFCSHKNVRRFVRARRGKLMIFSLQKRAPELNPDEEVFNEIKNNQIGRQTVNNKVKLKELLISALNSLK